MRYISIKLSCLLKSNPKIKKKRIILFLYFCNNFRFYIFFVKIYIYNFIFNKFPLYKKCFFNIKKIINFFIKKFKLNLINLIKNIISN